MKHSEAINELTAALSKAQGQIKGAVKDSSNPFFKSSYADLSSVWDACRDPLSSNGLSVIQSPEETQIGVMIETMLCHSSGQWISSQYIMPTGKGDAQSVGSAITYGRRYALAAMIGIAPEDDDGNAASSGAAKETQAKKEDQKNYLIETNQLKSCGSLDQLQDVWSKLTPDAKQSLLFIKDQCKVDIEKADDVPQ